MLEKKPHDTEKVATHIEGHSDEWDARELAMMEEGRKAFPGIENAPVYLIDAGLHEKGGRDGDVRLVEDKMLCIGVNGGQFDEHAVPAAERQGHTAFSRMANWLGLQDQPAVKAMVAYSLRTDRVSKVFKGPFEIPHLVKAWWTAGFSLKQVLEMYHIIFMAVYSSLSGSTPVAQPEPGEFRRLIARWFVLRFGTRAQKSVLINQFSTGEDAAVFLGRVGDDVNQILELDRRDVPMVGPKFDFELEGIWEAMVRSGISSADRTRIIFACLNAKHIEQTAFLAACEEFTTNGAYVSSEECPYLTVVIRSDSKMMNRAARHIDPHVDVLVQLRSNGRYQIFDLHQRLEMGPVTMQLRIAEIAAHGRDRVGIEDLLSDGTLVQVPECFYWEEGHAVFNGTLTTRRTPITKLDRKQVVRAVLNGLAFIYRRYGVLPNARWRQIKREDKERRQAKRSAKLAQAQQA